MALDFNNVLKLLVLRGTFALQNNSRKVGMFSGDF